MSGSSSLRLSPQKNTISLIPSEIIISASCEALRAEDRLVIENKFHCLSPYSLIILSAFLLVTTAFIFLPVKGFILLMISSLGNVSGLINERVSIKVFLVYFFSLPSSLQILPLKSIISPCFMASALIGVVHPPISARK